MGNHPHLAWHETLEIHELVAFQSIGLMKLKETYKDINEPTLLNLYEQAIHGLTNNIQELLAFYPMAPGQESNAITITETATPALRKVLKKQLNSSIDLHAAAYSYMYNHGYYPSYDLNALLNNDLKLAKKSISK